MMQFRISAVLLFAVLRAAAQDGVAFTNPVWRADAPDPTCWRGDDFYYQTSTARALLKSTDLVHWQKVRDDFLAPGERALAGREEIVAHLLPVDEIRALQQRPRGGGLVVAVRPSPAGRVGRVGTPHGVRKRHAVLRRRMEDGEQQDG